MNINDFTDDAIVSWLRAGLREDHLIGDRVPSFSVDFGETGRLGDGSSRGEILDGVQAPVDISPQRLAAAPDIDGALGHYKVLDHIVEQTADSIMMDAQRGAVSRDSSDQEIVRPCPCLRPVPFEERIRNPRPLPRRPWLSGVRAPSTGERLDPEVLAKAARHAGSPVIAAVFPWARKLSHSLPTAPPSCYASRAMLGVRTPANETHEDIALVHAGGSGQYILEPKVSIFPMGVVFHVVLGVKVTRVGDSRPRVTIAHAFP
jgi:hypothetical protein